jgi:twinkle protein
MTKSNFVKHTNCDNCGSSNANSLYDDGHTYCFVCETYKNEDGSIELNKKETKPMNKDLKFYDNASINAISNRGISQTTCLTYGVKQDPHGNKHYYPYFDADGVMVAIKTRDVPTKNFSISGEFKDATLFGQQLFAKGGRTLTICEGEADALASYQMQGSKYAVVSIRNGAAAALKDCKANYEYIDSFETVVIDFDADEAGRKAAQSVAELFGGKVKILKHRKDFKDACDYLKAGSAKEYVDAWWQAEAFIPDGIISAISLIEDLKKPLTQAPVLYPWEGLNKLLYGIRPAELVTLAAGSGLGKSTILRELVSHILNNTDEKVGLAFLEETPERTMRGLLGLEINKKIHLPDAVYSPDEIDYVYKRLDLENRVYLWNHFGSNAIENVLNRLRYFVKALGCKYLVLDHLSILISDQAAGDERKNIDMVMTKLRTFVQEVNCSLLLVSHLKRPEGKSLEDGAVTSLGMLRGSGSIAQLSDAVIGAERNSQADDLIERNTTRVRVLKSRYTGYTGHACSLFYDDFTGRLREVIEDNTL